MNENAYFQHLDELHSQNWPKKVPRTPTYRFGEIPLTDYLGKWAALTPDKPVCVYYGTELTFRELDRLSDAFASLLKQEGIGRGDTVAVMLPNCPQFLVAFYGVMKSGAVFVPINPLYKPVELLHVLTDTAATIILSLDVHWPMISQVQERTKLRGMMTTGLADMLPADPTIPIPDSIRMPKPSLPAAVTDLMTALADMPAGRPDIAPDLDAIAVLNYTGGTTGLPKACMHTQRNMLYKAAVISSVGANVTPDDVLLNFVPVFWIAGETVAVILPVFAGCTSVLLTRWDVLGFMTAIDRYRVTMTGGLVDNIDEILEHPRVGEFDFTSLLDVRVSSFVKKLTVEYRERWKSLTGTTLMESAWGMTETHTYDCFTTGMQDKDFDLKSRPVFVGLPGPGTRIKICDFETGELVPLGSEGEICCRTPSLFKGYWNPKPEQKEFLRDGWFHTGDIGMYDEHGYLHFLGRRKEMLKVNGMSVFPPEIEALLCQHPAVAGAAVIGRADEKRGEVPVAFVQLKPEAQDQINTEELTAWCRENFATYKVPEIHFTEVFPVTATGKIKKNELASLLELRP